MMPWRVAISESVSSKLKRDLVMLTVDTVPTCGKIDVASGHIVR